MKQLLLLIFIFSGDFLFATVIFKNDKIVFENELLVTRLSFQNGQIIPESFFSKELNKELLDQSSRASWFEFVVNKKLLKSNDPIWKYRSHEVRKLNNGGEEVKITVEATRWVKGLRLEIYRQFFPGSTLIRERIVLRPDNKNYSLDKLNGKLHFIFPRYVLQSTTETNKLEEIRIATFSDELLQSFNPENTYDDRKYDNVRDFNLANCHMFHPKTNNYLLQSGDSALLKGPFGIFHADGFSWLSTYEHASQDKNFGAENSQAQIANQPGSIAIDQQQGVVGESGLKANDDDFLFMALKTLKTEQSVQLSLNQLRGSYLDGEQIDNDHPYETVWAASAFIKSDSEIKPTIHHYLWTQITEHPESRKSHFYYNTWGMQRDVNNKTGLRDIFTESRMLEEIRNAAQLKVDLFVLDDGWEQTMGEWQAHKTRLPNGLQPLIVEMRKNKMIPGVWLSPMGIDSLSDRYKEHPEWVIRNKNGKPIKAQWNFPAFDFVSGFGNLFVADCKKLVDQGIRFFKWDAINTFDSTLPNLNHGTSSYSKQEIRDRYAYLLPFYITRAMKELREYNPDVVVEIDLTEKERCIIGLMPLQEGKFFWMNNGASGYNDYSHYRTKSMRTVINRYAGILPTELFTQAVYPQNEYPFFAQRYNVNTTLAGGRGFWGNLKMMKPEQRIRVGNLVTKSKLVLPYIQNLPLEVSGSIGASPEIYTHINREKGAGQVIAFSSTACEAPVSVALNTENCLGVLNHVYHADSGKINLPFQFNRTDDTREAFILPNQESGIGIESSSAWLDGIELNMVTRTLTVKPGTTGVLKIRFPESCKKIISSERGLIQDTISSGSRFSYYNLELTDIKPIEIFWEN